MIKKAGFNLQEVPLSASCLKVLPFKHGVPKKDGAVHGDVCALAEFNLDTSKIVSTLPRRQYRPSAKSAQWTCHAQA
jgi:hypothetical protein